MAKDKRIVIDIEGLEKSYGSFKLNIPRLKIREGEFLGLVGENGAGKTTLIKLIMNLVKKDKGEIKIFGNEKFSYEIKNNIGVVFDKNSISGLLTVRETAKILKHIYKDKWDEELFFKKIDKHQLPIDKPTKSFSTGMKAKLNLFKTFAYFPKLMILDEATSNLDPIVRREINNELKNFCEKTSSAIIFSSHLVSELEDLSDRIVLIDEGKIELDVRKEDVKNYYIIDLNDKPDHDSDIIAIKEESGKTLALSYLSLKTTDKLYRNNNIREQIMFL